MSADVIETRSNKIWLDKNGILRIEVLPNITVTKADSIVDIAAGKKLAGDSALVLVDIRNAFAIEREARQVLADQKDGIAVALLVKSPLSKILTNFFLGLNKFTLPTRMFTSEEGAIEWLKGIKVRND